MTSSTKFGASVGGSHGATLASQNTKYGTLPVTRQFSSGAPGALATGLTTSQVMFYSFKEKATDYVGMANGIYDAGITTWARGLAASTAERFATYYHEPENDPFTFAQWQAAADHFFNLIRTMTGVVANLKSCLILMESTVLGWNGRNINNYWPPTHPPDHIGFDFDGPIVPAGGPYPNMSSWVAQSQAFAASKGLPWSVTEFGGSPTTADTTHAARTAWNNASAAQFAAGGAQYVIYWDDGDCFLSQTNEINAWKALVGQAPTTVPAAPTGLTITLADDGLSATLGWATFPGGIDHLDVYVQHPGETYPHKVNTGNLNITPRAYTFPTVPGGSYQVTAACATDTAGVNRSGWTSPFVTFQAKTPGPTNHSPVITGSAPVQDATNPLLWHLPGAATDPDGGPLTYNWHWTYPADRTVTPPADLTTATGDVTFPVAGVWAYTFTVTDNGGLAAQASDSITIAQTASAYTDFLNLQMLQHRENVQDMAIIEAQAKPLIDAAVKALAFRRSPHNARHGLVASNYDPGDQAGTTVVTPATNDFFYTTLVLEGDTIAHLVTVTSVAQIGSGAMGVLLDATGAILVGIDPFSIDAWLQQAPGGGGVGGVVAMDVPQPITRIVPGTLFAFGMWWPSAVSTKPSFRVRPAGGMQAGVGQSGGALIFGKLTGLSAVPTSVDFTTGVVNPELFIGVPVP